MKCCAGKMKLGTSRLAIISTITVIAALVATVIFNFYYSSRATVGDMIVRDVQIIARALERIHKDCTIVSIDYKSNIIDFLNVATFSGSEVGPLNLLNPDRWRGPYLQDNPTIAGKEYLLVNTRSGYYVVPGVGVRLPNGNIMGSDIVIDATTDVNTFMRTSDALTFRNQPLIARVDILLQLRASQVLPDLSDF